MMDLRWVGPVASSCRGFLDSFNVKTSSINKEQDKHKHYRFYFVLTGIKKSSHTLREISEGTLFYSNFWSVI